MKIFGDHRSGCCLSWCRHIGGCECGCGDRQRRGNCRVVVVVVAAAAAAASAAGLFQSGNDAREPLRFGARVMLVEELFHAFVSADEIEVDNERQLLEIDGTQEHGLFEVLFQMARAVHATVQVDAMLHAEQVARLVNEQLARANQQYGRQIVARSIRSSHYSRVVPF